MERVFYLIAIPSLLFLQGCNNEVTEITIRSGFSPKDYIEVNTKLYEPKDNLYPILDFVIDNVNRCPANKNSKIGYSLWVNYVATVMRVSIFPVKDSELNIPPLVDAVFYYKGYQFNYNGPLIDNYIKNTNKTIKEYRVDPKFLFHNPDEENNMGCWVYVLENGKLKLGSYDNCGNSWSDEKYFRGIPSDSLEFYYSH